ncbi:hypothetical protein SAMN05660860_02451 [Geoalkalibacter ferrihydriticus]|uniref:Uncharacterized protein n=2 Tax=Geoalkalibacter ferrihydriticus TaxID=392333 RepID=A0A0C2HLE7_9BACT|nr:hypothetical protein [Geoalkalibacter ferrihydriticus]KIH77906.1 hypothetical protein GFER_04615 [Geoalkalibacter ferrihydriticus DSM 17813]SDM38090.1 hypothetical protein SAMN05660860_02451 [Geoalkalibacter ferrihydriticus]
MSSRNTPTVGGHIDSQCTRCRMLTNHTVVAMVADRPVKVQCNTCGGLHGYRAPKAAPKARAAVPRRVTDKPAAASRSADHEQWNRAVADKDQGEARAYGMDDVFRADELIRHPMFGLGVVTATIKPNKMEVLFEQGRKTLRCRL